MNRLKNIKKAFSTQKIVFEYENKNVRVLLNNEKVLNAIDMDMLEAFKSEIEKWNKNNSYPEVMLISSNDNFKAFSAGGDVVSILNLKKDNPKDFNALEKFFKVEFELDYLISKLKDKNVITIALWNGITIGGGLGITLNCLYKVACEKTSFAMPEARIGLFTDIAANYHLNKLPEGIRNAIGLACYRLKGEELALSNLATDFVELQDLPEIRQKLMGVQEENFFKRKSKIDKLLAEYSIEIEQDKVEKYRNKVDLFDREYTGKTVEEIYEKASKSEDELVKGLYKNMQVNSPLSMKLIYQHLIFSKQLDLRTQYLLDFQIIQHVMRMNEFFIGVQNLLVDKAKEAPEWTYKSLSDVPDQVVENIIYEKVLGSDNELDKAIFKI